MNTLTEEKKKIIKENKLPFLQAQILEKIYLDIHSNSKTSLEEISELTGYKSGSKILLDAISALEIKEFISGNFDSKFLIPSFRNELYQFIIGKNDYKEKKYSSNILEFKHINDKLSLFKDDSDVNEIAFHKWYDYLEDFPQGLINKKIKEYGINKNSLIVDPFIGSGTTSIVAKQNGIKSIGFDASPLMIFISKVKTTWDVDIRILKTEVTKISKKHS